MELLNRIILGPNAGTFPERVFAPVDKSRLGNPDYDPRFFEAFPSLWANAYAFQKALDPRRARDNATADEWVTVVEEWVCLFFLYYFGVLHLEAYDSERIADEYDKDLWTAIGGTYIGGGELRAVRLLKTSDGVVVGGYYPRVVFFPSRGRSLWRSSKSLVLYLNGTTLSWQKCKDNLLTDQTSINRFFARLNAIAHAALEGDIREALVSFTAAEPVFQHAYWPPEYLGIEPERWPVYDEPNEEKLLSSYPLQTTRDGKRTFYLVSGFPFLSDWMSSPIAPGMPAPVDYTKANDVTLQVDFGGRSLTCPLKPGERMEFLRDLFLSDNAFGCVVDSDSLGRVDKASAFHRVLVLDGKGDFAQRNKGKYLLCTAPLRSEFVEAFPATLSELGKKLTARVRTDRDVAEVDWSLSVLGRDIRWSASLDLKPRLSESLVALWPPKVSRDWRLYVSRGTGNREDAGRWRLIDENGSLGAIHDLDEREYVSVLNDEKRPNRPRAMLVTDSAGLERGVLFLKPLTDVTVGKLKKATLAIDFGTSNTCMAVKIHGDQSEPPEALIFSQKPLPIWGEIPEFLPTTPVFAPLEWAGKKGFYPTVLFVRRSITDLARVVPQNLELKHLFRTAIPGLHSELDNRAYVKENPGWEVHWNLKWQLNPDSPYRALFLWLSLIYAHAEVFFRYGAAVEDYVFTLPLALPKAHRADFHKEAKFVVRNTRRHCYGDWAADDVESRYKAVDESTAIGRSALAAGNPDSLDVFIDLGGGTADIAIRHHTDFVVLDSIPVAGATFFKFAKKNFSPPSWYRVLGADEFGRSLRLLLPETFGTEADLTSDLKEISKQQIPLATYYTLLMNPLDDEEFTRRERLVLDTGLGRVSYQKFWTQSVLRHVIAYALLQACAAIVNGQIPLKRGIKLALAGNAWALMMFAGLHRTRAVLLKECQDILEVLKKRLSEHPETKALFASLKDSLRIFDLKLLNENVIGEGKTALAKGAVLLALDGALRQEDIEEGQPPFSGMTLRNVRINDEEPITIRWCDRWQHERFAAILGESGVEVSGLNGMRISIGDTGAKAATVRPFDPILEGFVQLCNVRTFKEGQLEPQEWDDINSRLLSSDQYLDDDLNPSRPPVSVFLSQILYSANDEYPYMELLATRNLNPKEAKSKSSPPRPSTQRTGNVRPTGRERDSGRSVEDEVGVEGEQEGTPEAKGSRDN